MKLIRKRFWSLVLCTAMVVAMLPVTVSAASADTTYVDEHGITKTVSATVINGSSTTLASGWYVVNSTVSTGTITINGDVRLILADGATLTATDSNDKAGIGVIGSNCLTIYGQTGGTGTLIATGSVDGAGIGGSSGTGSGGGTINIYGGIITASSKGYGAGIGGGRAGGEGSTVNIYGGIITAVGVGYGAGIGGGSGGSGGGTVSIYGGTVTATSSGGAGIGGGFNGAGSTVNIYGGKVAATSTDMGAGIGGGVNCGGGAINIYGGTITARGSLGPDIGAGSNGSGSTCVIAGGSVNASTILPAPTNGSGNGGAMVYRSAVTLKDISTATKVNSLTISAGYYSTNSLYTDVSGKLYLWLPVDTTITAAATAASTSAGGSYLGTVTTTSSGTASGNLIWNHAPTDITLSASTVAENIASDSTCGTLSTTDANTGDTFTYSLVNGAGDSDNSAFTISGSALKLNITPDYEVKNSYSIRIRSTDAGGLYFEKVFTITITNVNEAPVITAPATLQTYIGSPTSITGISFTDPDAGDNLVTVGFSVTSGTWTAPSQVGVVALESGTTMNLTGTIANINSYLAAGNLVFTSAPDASAPVTLSITINDGGNSGSGGVQGANTTMSIVILATTTSVSGPANGIYKAGDNLDFIVNFDKTVIVDTSGGIPYLSLTVGSSMVHADYQTGSGTTSLVFRYSPITGDNDADGISLGNAINLNGGIIQSEGVNAELTLNNMQSTSGVLVDTLAATVVTVTPANAATNVPANGSITVTFDEPMDVHAGTVILTNSDGLPVTLTPADGNWTDSNNYTISYLGLSYNANYTMTIAGFRDKAGNEIATYAGPSFTTEVEPLNPSVSPSNLTIDKNETKSLAITFGQGTTAATGASITVDNIGIATTDTAQVTSPGTITVTGLAVGTTNLTIAFNDTLGTTDTITVTVLPVAPSWFSGGTLETSNITSTGAILTWAGAQDSTAVTGYKIYQDGTLISTVSGTTTSYEVSGLSASTAYSFCVQAGNADDAWTTDGPDVSITTTETVSTGGNANNSDASSTISSDTDPIAPQPAEELSYPSVYSFVAIPAMDKKGHATTTLPENYLEETIARALADAKAQGRTADEITVMVNLDLPATANSLGITISRKALKTLIDAGVKQFEINGKLITMNFDLETLREIQKKSIGHVTINIKKATGLSKKARTLIGTRPAYRVTISYVKNRKTLKITSFKNRGITFSIPYTPRENEATANLYAVYINGSGKPYSITESAYETNSGCMIFTTNRLTIFGVGYK